MFAHGTKACYCTRQTVNNFWSKLQFSFGNVPEDLFALNLFLHLLHLPLMLISGWCFIHLTNKEYFTHTKASIIIMGISGKPMATYSLLADLPIQDQTRSLHDVGMDSEQLHPWEPQGSKERTKYMKFFFVKFTFECNLASAWNLTHSLPVNLCQTRTSKFKLVALSVRSRLLQEQHFCQLKKFSLKSF